MWGRGRPTDRASLDPPPATQIKKSASHRPVSLSATRETCVASCHEPHTITHPVAMAHARRGYGQKSRPGSRL
eukprot:5038803-Prymnesium_polylepis.1